MVVPALTPVTVAVLASKVEKLMVATPVLPTDQAVDDVGVKLPDNTVVLPTHTAAVPEIVGRVYTVRVVLAVVAIAQTA